MKKFLEYIDSTSFEPIKSFYLKDELNPLVWETPTKIKPEIRTDLLKIANDFYESTELNTDIKDIVLTGSLANYNWSEKYSDFDLHILVDYSDINDDVILVKKLTDYAKKLWATEYDIKIQGYEVELYIQDINESHTSTGVYSLLNDKWLVEPTKKEFIPNEDEIKLKAEPIMIMVDDIEDNFNKLESDIIKEKLDKTWDKIKKSRQKGLEEGEFGTGNLVFKLLRRNGYINKVIGLKRKLYINQYK
jgi:hypothetical protein